MMKIFAAMYNPMIYESSFGILSLHKTRKGAEMAMEFHKAECKKEWDEQMEWEKERFKNEKKEVQEEWLGSSKFGQFESWDIFEYDVNET